RGGGIGASAVEAHRGTGSWLSRHRALSQRALDFLDFQRIAPINQTDWESNQGHGAQGRDRTTDTAIFSRMLYQLSYLGTSSPRGTWERGFIVRLACPVHHAEARPPCLANGEAMPNASIGVFVRVLASGNGVGIREPPIQVH